jgi:hypothetical protein
MSTLLEKLNKIKEETDTLTVSSTVEQRKAFLLAHPVLTALTLVSMGISHLLRLVYWLFVLALLVVGLKCFWLAVSWLWRLI